MSSPTVITPLGSALFAELAELWRFRELGAFLAWRDITVRYKQTVIGIAWAVLQPFATMVVFTLFFGTLARLPSDGLPNPVFFYSGLLPWMYFAGALQAATNSLVEHQRIITKVYFPRLLLPIAAVLPGLLDAVIASVMLIVLMLWYGVALSFSLLLVPALLVLTALIALACGLWLAGLNARYRDVRYAVPFLIQLWLFASPVVYPLSIVPERWRALYSLNPMVGVIDAFRYAVGGAALRPIGALAPGAIVTVTILVGGFLYFRRVEQTLADVV